MITMKMQRIRVAVPNDDGCLRCERILDDAAVRYALNQRKGTGTVLIYLDDELVQKPLDLLEQADFTADILRRSEDAICGIADAVRITGLAAHLFREGKGVSSGGTVFSPCSSAFS